MALGSSYEIPIIGGRSTECGMPVVLTVGVSVQRKSMMQRQLGRFYLQRGGEAQSVGLLRYRLRLQLWCAVDQPWIRARAPSGYIVRNE